MAPNIHTPGNAVALPPPFLFGAALLIGYLSAIVTWLFLRTRTPISPLSQPTALVLGGPYRFTRNPDYIGQTLLCAGIGLMRDAPAVLVATVPALLAVHYAVVPREERFLAQQLGAPYLEYLRRVRRRL